jgi:hypothetical protein
MIFAPANAFALGYCIVVAICYTSLGKRLHGLRALLFNTIFGLKNCAGKKQGNPVGVCFPA